MDPARLTSLEKSIRWLTIWSIVLTLLALVALGAFAGWAQAVADPPIQVYTARLDDSGAGGDDTGGVIQEINPTHTTSSVLTLSSVRTNRLSRDHDHLCVVTASARVSPAPSNATSTTAVFGLSTGRRTTFPSFNWVASRAAHLVVTSDEDSEYEEVTTTFVFRHVRRNSIIRFDAVWDSGGNMTVWSASMTVLCLKQVVARDPND